MLDHLATSSNLITIFRELKDRDGDSVGSFEIGTAYGIFRTSLSEEMEMGNKLDFKWVGILTKFKEAVSQEVVADYTIKNGDYCVWQGKHYYIVGVHERFDISGRLVGYWLGATDKVGR